MKKQHYMTRDERLKLEALLHAKISVTEIAKILGFSRQTIYNEKNVTVAETGDIHVTSTAEDMTQYAWVIDMILKGNRAKRIVIPIASITEMEEIAYKDNEPVGYGITLSAEPDASGAYHYEYIQASFNVGTSVPVCSVYA